MKRYRPFLVFTAIFAALLLALYLMLVLFATIPNASVRTQALESARYFVNEESFAFTEDMQHQNITDNYADQIWTNISWYMGCGNPFHSVLDTKYYDGGNYFTSAGLYMGITREHDANVDYTRYWHGTAGLIRMLHLFMDIQGVRKLGMFCLLLLVAKTILTLCRMGHWDLGLCVLASLLAVQFGNLRLSVEYLPSFLICFSLCPAFLRKEQKGDFYLHVLGVISGTLTAFFDFLTTETVTILIPLILVIAIRSRERRLGSPRQVMKTLAGTGLCWGAAYAGTFLAKWIAVSLATGADHIQDAWSFAENRISGVVSVGQVQRVPGLVMALGANFTALFEGTSRTEFRRAFGYLAIILVAIVIVYRVYRVRKKIHPGTGFLLLLGCVVFLRYAVLANHSYMHAFFTYRALASTILAVLSALVINLRPIKRKVV